VHTAVCVSAFLCLYVFVYFMLSLFIPHLNIQTRRGDPRLYELLTLMSVLCCDVRLSKRRLFVKTHPYGTVVCILSACLCVSQAQKMEMTAVVTSPTPVQPQTAGEYNTKQHSSAGRVWDRLWALFIWKGGGLVFNTTHTLTLWWGQQLLIFQKGTAITPQKLVYVIFIS